MQHQAGQEVEGDWRVNTSGPLRENPSSRAKFFLSLRTAHHRRRMLKEFRPGSYCNSATLDETRCLRHLGPTWCPGLRPLTGNRTIGSSSFVWCWVSASFYRSCVGPWKHQVHHIRKSHRSYHPGTTWFGRVRDVVTLRYGG